MKTFNKYLVEEKITDQDMDILKENLNSEWSPELEAKIDAAISIDKNKILFLTFLVSILKCFKLFFY